MRRAQTLNPALQLGLAALLLFSNVAAPRSASAAEPVRVRLGVVTDGITVVSPADLAAAGVDVAAVDPRTFALSSLGAPAAILVSGEDDGQFAGDDRLYFFGERFRGAQQDEKYTDERVYWLDIGGAPGPRIAARGARATGARIPPADFPTTLHAEDNRLWWTLHTLYLDTQDSWFWERLSPVLAGSVVTATMTYTVPHPAPAADATLAIELISRAGRTSLNPDHRTTVALNAAPILDRTWDGLHVRKVFTGTVPAGVLTHGLNEVQAGAWALPDNLASTTDLDDVYVNYWELTYRRLFRAFNGQLDFRAEEGGDREYLIAGWDTPDVLIWNVADPAQPIQLDAGAPLRTNALFLPLIHRGPAQGAGVGDEDVAVRFRALDPAGTRYWLQTRASARPPASVRLRPPTGLRHPAGGADTVIVTPAALAPAAERLAAWHRGHGRRTVVADIQDVYDEFNDGIYHPRAVPALLAWAAAEWAQPAPAFLTLVGDGHWNFKNYNPAVYPWQPNLIPPYLAWVDPWQGEVPAENRFGDINGDGSPEVAVGRLAVNTLAEANIVVDKIIAYDETVRTADWQRRALFVSDNPDYAGNFPAVSDSIIADYTPADLQVVKAYLPGAPPNVPATAEQIAATRDTILSTIQAGAWMVQYTGHGAPDRWTHESMWRTADVAGLTNGDRLPFVMTFNCLDGYFAHPIPTSFSLAELMQRQAGGGAIAAISPTGLGITSEQLAFRRVLLDVMFKDNVRELGAALTVAKQKFYATNGAHYLIETMSLFGDPALRLPAEENP